jgi:GTP diphosphokinase / guanosine-3',5'-bis(diphosphate) 3'-diphosphatase
MDNKIKEAERFTESAHKGQTQENEKPYVEHPKEVASLLKSWKQNDEVIIAGLLHDVVEDSEISLEEIKDKFGERVSLLVDGMSWIRNKETGKKDWNATYKNFSEIAKKDSALILIKAADLKSNISNLLPKNSEFIIKKAIPKNLSFYIPFLRETGINDIADEVESKYEEFSKEKPEIVLFNFISKKDLNKIKENVKNLLNK